MNSRDSSNSEAESKTTTRFSRLLVAAIQSDASDLHLLTGRPPAFRQHGVLVSLEEDALTRDDLQACIDQICTPAQRSILDTTQQVDCSYEIQLEEKSHRCRANVFTCEGERGVCIRLLPTRIPDFQWAGFPTSIANQITQHRDGLVICTGPTGSGKSTTMAMLINLLHQRGGKRIISIEEPIEYRFVHNHHSMVSQREVGTDVMSFADGLRAGLRQDPDIILVGEIRDADSARIALSAAETGHLVFTSLHTRDAKGAISRLLDLFPHDAQSDVRHQLSWALRAVIAQRLLPSVDPFERRKLALEVLLNIDPIPSAIRNLKLDSIDNYLITKVSAGMRSFDESIVELYTAGQISHETALNQIRDPERMQRVL